VERKGKDGWRERTGEERFAGITCAYCVPQLHGYTALLRTCSEILLLTDIANTGYHYQQASRARLEDIRFRNKIVSTVLNGNEDRRHPFSAGFLTTNFWEVFGKPLFYFCIFIFICGCSTVVLLTDNLK